MKLIEEIINGAVDDKTPLSTVLRQCLVLAHQLKNDRLKSWVEKELNGYTADDTLPPYREVPIIAKGLFMGPAGSYIDDQPIPSAMLKEQDRKWAEKASLRQPVAAYGIGRDKSGKALNGKIDWPANLTGRYQASFYQGTYALSRAWQEIASSTILELVEIVRNRVLQFALEIKEELGIVSDHIEQLPTEKVNHHVTNIIYGGTNVIAGTASDFTQVGDITVTVNDFASLKKAMTALGVTEPDIANLQTALEEDKAAGQEPTKPDSKAMGWVKSVAGKGLKVGSEVATSVLAKCIVQFLGLGH